MIEMETVVESIEDFEHFDSNRHFHQECKDQCIHRSTVQQEKLEQFSTSRETCH